MIAAKVFDAVEKAGTDLMKSTAMFTQDVVAHRFVPFCHDSNSSNQNSGLRFRILIHVIHCKQLDISLCVCLACWFRFVPFCYA